MNMFTTNAKFLATLWIKHYEDCLLIKMEKYCHKFGTTIACRWWQIILKYGCGNHYACKNEQLENVLSPNN